MSKGLSTHFVHSGRRSKYDFTGCCMVFLWPFFWGGSFGFCRLPAGPDATRTIDFDDGMSGRIGSLRAVSRCGHTMTDAQCFVDQMARTTEREIMENTITKFGLAQGPEPPTPLAIRRA